MTDPLHDFLRAGMGEPFSRGRLDCCTWPCNWIRQRTGIDPAAGLRGTYGTLAGAARIVRAHGGLLELWRFQMSAYGFAETADPLPGDVGVVEDAAGQIVAAVRVEGAWAAKAERGIVIEDFPALAAWSIPHG